MTPYDDNRDAVAEVLSQALAEEAATVSPTPGSLQSIQRRTARSSAARNPWLLGTLGAGLATAAVITAVVLVGDNGTDPSNATPPAASQPAQSGSPTTTAQPTTSPGVPAPHQGVYDPSAPASEQLTMYYVGPQPTNPALSPRLFSETHTVTDARGDMRLAAVNELLTSTPIDPDYSSGWPPDVYATGIINSGDGTSFVLQSSGEVWADKGRLDLALQALARTAGLPPGETEYFDYTVNGSSRDARYLVQPDDTVRAYITIDNIVDGQTMTNPVTVRVSGNTFEGTVNWELYDSTNATVDEGYVTTAMGAWQQADIRLGDLAPGSYRIRAQEYSAENGSPINVDDKTFTVE